MILPLKYRSHIFDFCSTFIYQCTPSFIDFIPVFYIKINSFYKKILYCHLLSSIIVFYRHPLLSFETIFIVAKESAKVFTKKLLLINIFLNKHTWPLTQLIVFFSYKIKRFCSVCECTFILHYFTKKFQ